MSEIESKIVSIVINLPIDVAMEIFRESGDLPVSEFPAITEFANNIGEALNIERLEETVCVKPAFIFRNRSKIRVSAKSSL